MLGSRLSHYEILSKIGAGGMGEVYRALDTRLGRNVALKVLPEALALQRETLARFTREARAVAALNHPNIVTVYSVEQAAGIHFLTMELIAGQPLDALLREEELSVERVLQLATQIVDAAAGAHARGIVHRDLKPSNLMVSDDGARIKVLDFGLARWTPEPGGDEDRTRTTITQTRAGQIMGSPHYMSPEQARGDAVDPRSDLFSLGIVIFEMASGRRPFQGAGAIELMSSILKDPTPSLTAVKPNLPLRLEEIVTRCLQKQPADRYPSASELLQDLEALKKSQAGPGKGLQTPSPDPERAPGPLGVAVLPLSVQGGDRNLEALGDALAEDFAAGLAAFCHLSVTDASARSGAESGVRDSDIAKQLGVRYLLSGSLRGAGDKVRLNVRVADALSGTLVWSDRFDRDLSHIDVFDLQDEWTDLVVARVADGGGVLVRDLASHLRGRPDDELSASDWVIRTFDYWEQFRPSTHAELRAGLEKAVERQPHESAIWACLSQTFLDEYRVGFNPGENPLDRALDAAQRSVELDPRSSLAWESLADALFFRRDLPAFRLTVEKALAANPRDATTLSAMGMWLALAGDYDRGLELAERAMTLLPDHPGTYQLAPYFFHFARGEYEQALDAARKVNMPDFFWNHMLIAAACGRLGLIDEGRSAVERLSELLGDPAADARKEAEKLIVPVELLARFLEGLRAAGLPVQLVES